MSAVPEVTRGAGHRGRIVVGVDGTPASERALRWAADAAPRLGGDIEVLDVSTSAEWVYTPGGHDHDARRAVDDVVRDVFGGSPPAGLRVSVESSDAVVRLQDLSRGARLLVVGRRSRAGGAEPPDPVGMRVAATSDCPVLVVP